MDRSPSAENRAPYHYDVVLSRDSTPIKSRDYEPGRVRRISRSPAKSVLYSPEVAYRKEQQARRKQFSTPSPNKGIRRTSKSPSQCDRKSIQEAIIKERKKLEDIPKQHEADYNKILSFSSKSLVSQDSSISQNDKSCGITFLGATSSVVPLAKDNLCHEYQDIIQKLENVAQKRAADPNDSLRGINSFSADHPVVNLNISQVEEDVKRAEKNLFDRLNNVSALVDESGYAIPQRIDERGKSDALSEDFRSPLDSPSKFNISSHTPTNRLSPDDLFFTPMVERKKYCETRVPGERSLINHQVDKVTNTLKRMTEDDKNELVRTAWQSPQKKALGEGIPDFEDYRQSLPVNFNIKNGEARCSLPQVIADQDENLDSNFNKDVSQNQQEQLTPTKEQSLTDEQIEQNLSRPRSLGAKLSVQINYSEHIDNMEQHLDNAEKMVTQFKEQALEESTQLSENVQEKSVINSSKSEDKPDLDELLDGIELFEGTLIEPELVPKQRRTVRPMTRISEDIGNMGSIFSSQQDISKPAVSAAQLRRNSNANLRVIIEKYCNDVKTLEKLELRKLIVYRKLGLSHDDLKGVENDVKAMSESMIADAHSWLQLSVGKDFVDRRNCQLAKLYNKVSAEIKLLANLLLQKSQAVKPMPVITKETSSSATEPIKNLTCSTEVQTVWESSNIASPANIDEDSEFIPKSVKVESPIFNFEIKEEGRVEDRQDPSIQEMESSLNSSRNSNFMNSLHSPSESDKPISPDVTPTITISVPPLNLSCLADDIPLNASGRNEMESTHTSQTRESLPYLNDSEVNSSRLNASERSDSQRKSLVERFMTISPKSSPKLPGRQFPSYTLDGTFNDSRIFSDILSPSKLNQSVEKLKNDELLSTPKEVEKESTFGDTTPLSQPSSDVKRSPYSFDFLFNESCEELEGFLGITTSKQKQLEMDTPKVEKPVDPSSHYALLERNVEDVLSTIDTKFDLDGMMKVIRSDAWAEQSIKELCQIVWKKKNEPDFEGFVDVDLFEDLERLDSEIPKRSFTSDQRCQTMHDEMRILHYASVLNIAADLWPMKKEKGLFGFPKTSVYCNIAPEDIELNDFFKACTEKIIGVKDLYHMTGRIFKNDSDPEKMALQLMYCDRGFMDANIEKRVKELEVGVIENVTNAIEAEIVTSLHDKTDENSLFGSLSNSSFFSQGLLEGRFSIGRPSSIARESLSKRTPSPMVLTKIDE